MLKIVNYDVVFSEIPGETTLALNISNCCNNCRGCHSPYLRTDIGDILDKVYINNKLEKYIKKCTCVLFLGEGNDQTELLRINRYIKNKYSIKTALYSGRKAEFIENDIWRNFDYVKTGPYIEEFGPLDNPNTNQKLWKLEEGYIPGSINGKFVDITNMFWK